MSLKPTYFDICKERDPILVEFLEKEVLNYNNSNQKMKTFEQVEDFSIYFKDYLKYEILNISKYFKEDLNRQGKGNVSDSEIIETVKNYMPEEATQMMYSDYITLFNFMLFNKKTFLLSNHLCENLALTKLDISSKYLFPPFDCCLFIFDNPEVIYAFNKMIEKDSNIVTLPINVFIIHTVTDEGYRKLLFICIQADKNRTQTFIKREIMIKEDWTIEDSLNTDWRNIFNLSKEETENDEELFFNEGLLFFRIILNSILYLGSNEIDIQEKLSPNKILLEKLKNLKSSKKLKNTKKKLSSTSSLDYSLVGQNIKPIIVKKPSIAYDSSSNFSKIIKNIKFLVRGHWRKQHYDKNNSKTKLIWIEPYFKGDELGKLINKNYSVN